MNGLRQIHSQMGIKSYFQSIQAELVIGGGEKKARIVDSTWKYTGMIYWVQNMLEAEDIIQHVLLEKEYLLQFYLAAGGVGGALSGVLLPCYIHLLQVFFSLTLEGRLLAR